MRCSDMDAPLPPQERHRRAQAARWLARLQAGDCTAAERAACRRWQAADPANAAAYAQMEALHRHSAELGQDPERRAVANALRARSARRARRRRLGRWGLSLSAAAALVLAVGLGWRHWDPAQPERTYASAVGEQRTFTLDDGSRLLLDTDSAVRVRYSRQQRRVELQRGQAQFTVAKAPERPFTVQAGAASVRAVGTQFQVRRYPDGVRVNLLEGAVEVTAPPPTPEAAPRTATLAPGEQLTLDTHGQWVRHPLDREMAEGWTRGELVFRQTPLAQLVDEMNRYTPVKLRLADPALRDIRLSGVFYGSDQASLVDALEQVWSLRTERRGDEIIVRR